MDDIIDVLQKKLGVAVLKKNELVFRDCPICGNDRNNFQVSTNHWVYHCWVCGAGGKLRKLLMLLGVVSFEDIEAVEAVEVEREGVDLDSWELIRTTSIIDDYFVIKHIDPEDLVEWGVRRKGTQYLFPFYDNRDLVYFLVRDMHGGYWRKPKGWSRDILSLLKIARGTQRDEIVLVESVSDGIRVFKAGFDVMVLAGTSLQVKDKDVLQRINRRIIVALDNDVSCSKYDRFREEIGDFKVAYTGDYEDPSDMGLNELKDLLSNPVDFGLGFRFRKQFGKL